MYIFSLARDLIVQSTRNINTIPYHTSLNKHHNYLALLLLNNDADLVQHCCVVVAGAALLAPRTWGSLVTFALLNIQGRGGNLVILKLLKCMNIQQSLSFKMNHKLYKSQKCSLFCL